MGRALDHGRIQILVPEGAGAASLNRNKPQLQRQADVACLGDYQSPGSSEAFNMGL